MFAKARESEQSLVEITWDEFFDEFEAQLRWSTTKSMFNKLVGRDTAERRERSEHGASRHQNGGRGPGQAGMTTFALIRRPVTGWWVTPSWAACPACRSA